MASDMVMCLFTQLCDTWRGKFASRAEPRVLISISDQYSVYKIWILEDNKIMIFCDVHFYKEVFPYKSDLVVNLILLNPIECNRWDVTIRIFGFGQIQ